jgi:hypothetical protein
LGKRNGCRFPNTAGSTRDYNTFSHIQIPL